MRLLRVSSNSLFCAALQLPQVWTQAASICPLYSLAVTAEDGRRYRNPHCAACNGRDLNTTSCDLGTTSCDPNTTSCDLSTTSCDPNTTSRDLGTTSCDSNTTSCDLGPGPRRRPASGVLARLMVPALTFLLQYTPGQVSSLSSHRCHAGGCQVLLVRGARPASSMTVCRESATASSADPGTSTSEDGASGGGRKWDYYF